MRTMHLFASALSLAAADMSKANDEALDVSLPELEAMPLWDYEVSQGHVTTP